MGSFLQIASRCFISALAFALAAAPAIAQTKPKPPAIPLFEANSSSLADEKIDIKIREIERRPRASVLVMDARSVDATDKTSHFILCGLRRLDIMRGGIGYIVKLDETPRQGQTLIGFLKSAGEPPGNTDPLFAAAGSKAQVADVGRFAQICGKLKL